MQKLGSDEIPRTLGHKSFSLASYKKFENVQRLHSIVDQLHNRRQGNEDRYGMPEKVLDIIKTRIKSSYDTMYSSYQQNRGAILKQIHQVQKNDDTENVMNRKMNHIIKEKNEHDRLKTELERKRKEIDKLTDLREKLKLSNNQNTQLVDTVKDRYSLVAILQEERIFQDYQTAQMANMRKERKFIKINLKERYQTMLQDNNNKQHRIRKLEDGNHTKRFLLKKIQTLLTKEQQFEMPLALAEELQRKLGEFQGKHNYANIVEHETLIQKERLRQQQQQTERDKESARKLIQDKQKQEKRQYEIIENYRLIKKSEQEKIKRLCGLNNIRQLTDNPLQSDLNNLQTIRQQIETQFATMLSEKQELEKEIQMYLTVQKQSQVNETSKESILSVQKELENEETQLRRLHIYYDNKKQLLQSWVRTVQFITGGEVTTQNMVEKLKQIIPRMQKMTIKLKTIESSSNLKNKIGIKQQKSQYLKLQINPNKILIQESQFNDDQIN